MIALELFGCSGGMAVGFRRAGLPMTFAFDWDADACASYEVNLHHRPVQIDVRDLERLAAAGWSPGGPVDLLVADPPCAPWSRAGKRRGLGDERDMLVTTCEIIRHLRPNRFLIGNVPGLDDGPALVALRRTIGGLSRLGYCIDYQRLDAANYGVPQHRHRPFWFGHLVGACITWPAPTHADPRLAEVLHLPGMMALRSWVTCREALAHLPLEELGRPVKLRWKPYHVAKGGHRPSQENAPARTLTRNANGDGSLLTHPRHPFAVPDEPSVVVTGNGGASGGRVLSLHDIPQGRRRARAAAPAPRASVGESMLEWPWGSPSTTANGQGRQAPQRHHQESGTTLSHPYAIVLSEKAAATLQGFPEGWTFHGATKKSRWSQIGMAVPPPLAHAVATSVRAAMEST